MERLRALAKSTHASAVFWNRRYEPAAVACSSRVKSELQHDGLQASSFNSTLLSEPAELLNQSGKPYQVYGAFLRNLLNTLDPPAPLPLPRDLRAPPQWPHSVALETLGLLPNIEWTQPWRPRGAPVKRGRSRASSDFSQSHSRTIAPLAGGPRSGVPRHCLRIFTSVRLGHARSGTRSDRRDGRPLFCVSSSGGSLRFGSFHGNATRPI